VLVVPCIAGRTESATIETQAGTWGSILPATWSFMLAARARGLGACWTTLHLFHEREAAALLGIPYAEVMQAALIPVAHTIGAEFRPGPRKPLAEIVHWDRW
jgi:nitroreductase